MHDELHPLSRHIFVLRGKRVMLDRRLAELYRVSPRRLREQVKRNAERFPEDFMIALSAAETRFMVSQNATPSMKQFGGSLPYAFTQEGVAMLSSVLRSKHAVAVNIQIMRAFVRHRGSVDSGKALRARLDALEKKCDSRFRVVFDAIRGLIDADARKRIGFRP